MTASLKTAGAWARVVSDPSSVTIPGSPAAGDRMFLFANWKTFSITVSDPSGWTPIVNSDADGTAAATNGGGSVSVAAWYRDWQSGDGDPSLDWSAAPTEAHAVIMLWQKEAGDTWPTPVFAVGAIAAADPFTVDAESTLDIPDGAAVACMVSFRDDSATMGRATDAIDDTGGLITWNGDYVESPATHYNSTTGLDASGDLGHRFVTTGAAGVTLHADGDLSAAESGNALFLVIHAAPPATDANAELAAGTGAAYTAAISLAPTAEHAAGSGTASVASVNVQPEASNAAGTGSALAITAAIETSGGDATGSGVASDPGPSVAVNAGLASGSGVALDPSVDTGGGAPSWGPWSATFSNPVAASTEAQAGLASGSGGASDASASIAPNGDTAAGSGEAFGVASAIASSPALASGAGTAPDASASLAPNGDPATGSGSAGGATSTVSPTIGAATGSGAALDATISTSENVSVNAGLASGSGAAGGASPSVGSSGSTASGAGSAGQLSADLITNSGAAAGTGAAGGPSSSVGALAVIAIGAGVITPASLSIAPRAGLASGAGSAFGISTIPPALFPHRPRATITVRETISAAVTVRDDRGVTVGVRGMEGDVTVRAAPEGEVEVRPEIEAEVT